MNKRQLHHFWRYFRQIKPLYFLLAALVCGVICVFAMRANSQHMAELRQAVFTADEQAGDVQKALNELQAYVMSHMNTSLYDGKGAYPPIQLQYTYQRLVEQQGGQQQNANSEIYTQAQDYCQRQNPTGFSGGGRVPCIQKYVSDRGGLVTVNTATIPPSLYQYDFVAAKWSPDLAGWSLVATIVLTLLAIVKFLVDFRIRRLVK